MTKPQPLRQHEKVVFAITDNKDTVILGVPEAAWNYMKNGHTHTFDLQRFGIPVKIVLFGGKDQTTVKECLNIDQATLDVSGLDVGFGGE